MKKILIAAILLFASHAWALSPAFIGATAGLNQEAVAWSKLAAPSNAVQKTTDKYVDAIKYGAGVTFSSITGNISAASGVEFLTRLSQDFRWLAGWPNPPKLTLAAAGNSATMYGGVAGTGETYSDIVTGDDSTFASDTGWWSKGAGVDINVTSPGKMHIQNGVATAGIYKTSQLATGRLYKATGEISTLVFGGLRVWIGSGYLSGTFTANFTHYGTYTSGNEMDFAGSVNGTTLDLDNATFSQVLTPDTTGLSVTTLTLGSLNPNAAAFDLTVTRN